MDTKSTIRKSGRRQSFEWTPEMAENLIESIQFFKASVAFKNLDFNTDRAA